MSVTIRRMRWWDVPDIVRAEKELFPRDAWPAEAFWSELAQDTRHYVVATDDGELAGYAGLGVTGSTGDVQTLAVAAEHQGRGVGRRLLADLLSEAAVRGATEVLLEVRSDNAAAIHLYEECGFSRISVRRDYYTGDTGVIDAIVMRLRPVHRG